MHESRTKMVSKGTVAHTSELGHYNFYYPNPAGTCTFLSDAIIQEPTWPKRQGLTAVSVLGSFLKGSEYDGNKNYIVWVKASDIERY